MHRNIQAHKQMLITCAPGPAYFGVTNLPIHNIGQVAEPQQALAQHAQLVKTMKKAGCEVVVRTEFPGHPNSVFTKDTAVCTPHGYIRLRMGLPSREGEDQWMAAYLDQTGIPCAGSIKTPGTVEGGDIILGEKVAFIGQSSRTNSDGVRQIRMLFRSLGYETRTVTVPFPFLHLGGCMTLVSPESILVVRGVFPGRLFRGFHTIEISSEGFISGNVIPLPRRQVIAERANEPAIALLRNNNFTVFPVDLSEFVKGTGGPSCLTLEVIRNFP